MNEWQPIETAPKDRTPILAAGSWWGCFAVVFWISPEMKDTYGEALCDQR